MLHWQIYIALGEVSCRNNFVMLSSPLFRFSFFFSFFSFFFFSFFAHLVFDENSFLFGFRKLLDYVDNNYSRSDSLRAFMKKFRDIRSLKDPS